jgi:3-isopropylmalate/(R)-2-methylmalate dehydratase small subunit
MNPFVQHTGLVVPLERDNIDTDAIIPKQFMKSIARTGFGPYVFDEWRYLDEGYYGKPLKERTPNPEFILNAPRYADASILLSGKNFGCGSSREHAPWALYQYGFRVLIAVGFADIFFNNCCKNGLLPVVLEERQLEKLQRDVAATPGYRLVVDLEKCTVTTPEGEHLSFEISSTLRKNLLEGIDEVGATLLHASEIKAFEQSRIKDRPWL